VLSRCFFDPEANLKDGDNGPEKRVEILPTAFTKSSQHLTAVTLTLVVRLQGAELPAKQIHP